ncbi:hypothetical protein BGX27_001224 [Mortierella sp. AM989]|nr:hypothetical protein BGX27_001224 [Mortierella sp. AM989]
MSIISHRGRQQSTETIPQRSTNHSDNTCHDGQPSEYSKAGRMSSRMMRVGTTRTGLVSIAYTAFILLLATGSILSILQPVSATTAAAVAPTGYQGPLPRVPDNPYTLKPEYRKKKGPIRMQRLSHDQHPKWNTDCLLKQEQLNGEDRINMEEGSSVSNNNQNIKNRQLQKRDGFGKRDRERVRRAVNTTSPLVSLAAVDSPDMRCNGRADLCDLRYNQVTYAGTHNSAAYDLEYDCEISTQACLESKTVCTAQAENCSKGWETRCTKMSNTCLDRMPNWLHWLCGAFSSTCQATEQVCLGWEQICTSSMEVCTLWGSACLQVIPDWAETCLWENQPNHPISQQLTDGIRFLDLGTCMVRNNTEVVMCHGYGAQRAIGVTLDSVMSQIAQFMIANPYEVLTVEFNQFDGDSTIMSRTLVQKILQYFTLPSGESMMWSRSGMDQPWPKLRDMILADKRIMIFMGNSYYPIPDPKPEWAIQKDTWKLDGFSYTSDDTKPAQLNQSYHDWCAKGPPNDGSLVKWQQMDINLAILESDIIDTLKKGKIPELCIGPLAVQTNSDLLVGMSNYCYDRWPYWFRIRVNDYWEGKLFQVVNHFNDRNVARVKAGDLITPY